MWDGASHSRGARPLPHDGASELAAFPLEAIAEDSGTVGTSNPTHVAKVGHALREQRGLPVDSEQPCGAHHVPHHEPYPAELSQSLVEGTLFRVDQDRTQRLQQ